MAVLRCMISIMQVLFPSLKIGLALPPDSFRPYTENWEIHLVSEADVGIELLVRKNDQTWVNRFRAMSGKVKTCRYSDLTLKWVKMRVDQV